MLKADTPTTVDNLQYHLHTGEGDLAPLCLIVGAPGRATMIAEKFFTDYKPFVHDYRGIRSYTGYYKGIKMSVTTSGMGGASMGITLPEAVRSGARLFIRVGSCGSLILESKPGESIIVSSAIRRDGASDNWAPKKCKAIAHTRVTVALQQAAEKIAPKHFYVGRECTTSCFYGGQGRPNIFGRIVERVKRFFRKLLKSDTACFSMEAATLFIWCEYEADNMPCGAINAIYANRRTNEWGTEGDEQAAKIALEALVLLNADSQVQAALERKIPYSV